MPKKIAVVDVLGHTLQVTETDDQLIVQEILPPPFLMREELPERRARQRQRKEVTRIFARERREQERALAPKPASAYKPVPKDAAERTVSR